MALYPDINGVRQDYSCVTITIGALPFRGVKSVNYSDSAEPGDVYGTGAQRIGRTRGQYKAEGSIEIYEDEWRGMLGMTAFLTKGYLEVVFPILVAYRKDPLAFVTSDVLEGCRIKKVDSSRQEGTEALTVKLDLDIMRIVRGTAQPLTGMLL